MFNLFIKPSKIDEPLTTDLRLSVFLVCLAICALFLLTLFIDMELQKGNVALYSWLSVGNVDDARVLLSSIIGAVSTVLGLVFSVVLLVLTMAATQFGPRLLRRFIIIYNGQVTIGLFTGTFLFTLLTLVVVRFEHGHEFVPQITCLTAVILMVISFGALISFSQRIRTGIQTGNLVYQVHHDLLRAINDYVELRKIRATESSKFLSAEDLKALRNNCMIEGRAILAETAGYLQAINFNSLVKAATINEATISLTVHPGNFVIAGTVVAYVIPAEKSDCLRSIINQSLFIGANRTLEQDPEFAFAQIVEIGIRALSAAVNDTFTGIACIDWMSNMIMSLVELPATDESWHDSSGRARLIELSVKFPRLVQAGFDMMRESAANNPAILIRMLQNFARIAPFLKTEEQRAAITRQVKAVDESTTLNSITPTDLEDINNFYKRVMEAL